MPLCPGCGNYSGEVGDTCPMCGATIGTIDYRNTCPRCGKHMDYGTRVCRRRPNTIMEDRIVYCTHNHNT